MSWALFFIALFALSCTVAYLLGRVLGGTTPQHKDDLRSEDVGA